MIRSQLGDGHICIPMCIALFDLFNLFSMPAFFETGVIVILAAGAVYFLSILLLGRLPRILGFGLPGGRYGWCLYSGLNATP